MSQPKSRKPSQKSLAEEAFAKEWKLGPCGSSRVELVPEYKFHPSRGWRFDYAYLPARIAIEIEGLGRHQTITGFRDDCTKYFQAARYGWTVFRLPTTDIARRNEWGERVIELFVEGICEHIVFGKITPENISSPQPVSRDRTQARDTSKTDRHGHQLRSGSSQRKNDSGKDRLRNGRGLILRHVR